MPGAGAQFHLLGHADGLKKTFLTNAIGQGREIAHVLAVAIAHFDGGDFEFFEHPESSPADLPF